MTVKRIDYTRLEHSSKIIEGGESEAADLTYISPGTPRSRAFDGLSNIEKLELIDRVRPEYPGAPKYVASAFCLI